MATKIEQIEFESVKEDVPVTYIDVTAFQTWVLVVGIMNVTFKPEQKQEFVDRLKGVIKILEEA